MGSLRALPDAQKDYIFTSNRRISLLTDLPYFSMGTPVPSSVEHPTCAVFGECGGCAYHHLSYEEELALKHQNLHSLLQAELDGLEIPLLPIVESPQVFHYRHRLDLAIRRIKTGEILMGFVHPLKHKIIQIKECPIALKPVSDFLPALREEAISKLVGKYRVANLTVRAGEEGRVQWGGIGKKSLKRDPKDYFWTEVNGRRIYYSLDTFFQANLSILPLLQTKILELGLFTPQTTFLDLYGGVGLFSLLVMDKIRDAILIEQNPTSVQLAQYNKAHHGLENWSIIEGPVEDHLATLLAGRVHENTVAMVDPPRKGMSEDSCSYLAKSALKNLLYLSCNPASLIENLKVFLKEGWKVEKIIPFDFFPRTPHLEALALLTR